MSAGGLLSPITGAGTSVITDQTASVSELSLSSQVTVFPNPSRNEFNVTGKANETYSFEVCDISGRIIDTGTFSGSTQLHIGSTGVYFVKVSGEDGVTVRKLVRD
jgi:hypothetical protein